MASHVVVLCYHGVSETWPAATTVTPGRLADQLEWLVGKGYRGATLADALTAPGEGRTVVVTFDDAHRSVLALAEPILSELRLPATVFAPTDYVERAAPMAWDGYDRWADGAHADELAPMSWDELGGLVERGWEVGSHTRSHPRLTSVDDEQLAREMVGSRDDCERRLGVACRSLAYPYSDFDDRVVRAAAEAGYCFAATVPRAPTAPLPLMWPRVGVYNGDPLWRLRLRLRRRSRVPRARS